jgi:nitrile hydratase accessory protein
MREFPIDQANFAEPWEARVFALTLSLADRGRFAWNEFRDLLIAEITLADAAERVGDPKPTYYECWLAAFEKLLAVKGMTDAAEVSERAEIIAANPPARTKAVSFGPVKIA